MPGDHALTAVVRGVILVEDAVDARVGQERRCFSGVSAGIEDRGDPRIDGVLYKDYAPYNRRQGVVSWHQGKPAVAYRYLLWEQKDRTGKLRSDWLPEGVAKAIAASPDDPTSTTEAFSVIQVHAWSFRSQGGPMEAIHDTIRKLPPRTRVVTAPDLIHLLQPLRPK